MLSRLLSAHRIAGIRHGLQCNPRKPEPGQQSDGLVVAVVAEHSPAARAGIKKGDILLCVGNSPAANRFDVERAFWDKKPGDVVEVKLLRREQESLSTLLLGTIVDEPAALRISRPKK